MAFGLVVLHFEECLFEDSSQTQLKTSLQSEIISGFSFVSFFLCDIPGAKYDDAHL